MTTYSLFVTCPRGLESVLHAELAAQGCTDLAPTDGGIACTGGLEQVYRANLHSRTAGRVLLRLTKAPYRTEHDIYKPARNIRWQDWFTPADSIKVHVESKRARIKNPAFVGLKIKDAVCDSQRDSFGERSSVDKQRPDIRIHAFLDDKTVQIFIDTSGEALFKRGYRQDTGEAPLRENLAAGLLLLAGYDGSQPFQDPFCGSGTIAIEAALIALNRAPGIMRRFGFEKLQKHDPALWQRIKQQAREAARNRPSENIAASDNDRAMTRAARQNARFAEVDGFIDITDRDAQDARPNGRGGIMLSNPPYGERLGTLSELVGTYDALGAVFKTFPTDWQMAIISSNPDLLKRLRLQRHKTYQAYNGGIETQIALYLRSEQHEGEGETHDPGAPVDEQARMLANRLRKNRRAAVKAAAAADTDAYRVYDQDMPEYAVAVDIYGDHIHVQEYAPPKTVAPEKARKRLLDALHLIPQILEIPAANLVLKTRERQRGSAQYQKQAARGEYLTVREGAAKLLVNLHDYLDTGLFLDHRPLRRRIHEEARDKRFLNLFCYTASASVQAALGGAAHTTSVDLSQTYLDWAHRNFDANELDSRHRLIKADVMAWLQEGDAQYDLILCDPPTFSNTKKEQRVFDVQRDHVTLIERCMQRLAPGGTLYFSNNYRSFKLDPAISARYHCEDISAATIDFDYVRRPNIHHAWKITMGMGNDAA